MFEEIPSMSAFPASFSLIQAQKQRVLQSSRSVVISGCHDLDRSVCLLQPLLSCHVIPEEMKVPWPSWTGILH